MEMEKITGTLFALGLVPVVKIEDAAMAPGLARALCEGGLPAAEITFRTPAAAEAIGRVHEAFPEMLLCAGTVLTPEQADAAMAAGASFIVSPGLNPRVVRHCQEKGYPVIPGCATPSDLEQALELGLQVVKFFPAEASGGVAAIKAMAAPYGGLRFMPTGGIGLKNLGDYLGFGKVVCCGGSFMVPSDAVEAGDFGRIAALTAEGVRAVHGFTIEEPGAVFAVWLGEGYEEQKEYAKNVIRQSEIYRTSRASSVFEARVWKIVFVVLYQMEDERQEYIYFQKQIV